MLRIAHLFPTPTRGRFRAYQGVKAPRYAAWVFAQLGAQAGDELEDLYPWSGAVSEAWRRYTAATAAADMSTAASAGAPTGRDASLPPAVWRGSARRVAGIVDHRWRRRRHVVWARHASRRGDRRHVAVRGLLGLRGAVRGVCGRRAIHAPRGSLWGTLALARW